MTHNIVIAGVGGQGILTIARVLSLAAISKGLNVKQAEVHGMSQRGGAVYSHLRISDGEIFSDLIPSGQADLILAIEPLEALRYVQMLRRGGTIVASTNAEVNISDYPQIERVLQHIAAFPNHVALDMEKLARAAGGVLAANIVALGAASRFLGFSVSDLEQAIAELFERKGERVVQTNLKAFRYGRTAAAAYVEAVQRGASPGEVRGWIQTLSPEHLASEDELEFTPVEEVTRLTGAEAHAFENLLLGAYEEGRKQLYEHEVYRLIELVGAISPPRHTFIPKGSTIAEDVLSAYPGDKVVAKLVSSEIVHKTEAGAVAIVPKSLEAVRGEIDRLMALHSGSAGVLLVEFIDHEHRGLGSELFVGIRATREFGPVIAAGLGGVQTEYLASKMLPGIAVAKAVAMDTDPEEFLEQFKQTVAYDILAGHTRGGGRLVSEGELLRCFRAFISIARGFCVDRGEEGPDIGELEVNPFAFALDRLIPLDGRGCLQTAARARAPRDLDAVAALLQPETIAMVGVSAKPESLGRIILSNVLKAGFPPKSVTVLKKDNGIEGIRCAEALTDPVDLLVITAPAAAVPNIIREADGRAKSAIIISGGAGEAEGTQGIGEQIEQAIREQRAAGKGCAVLGPNCMGVQSAHGHYDTFFVPESKMPSRSEMAVQPLALVSQSGAFIVSRLSSLDHLRPAFSISMGNQIDITVSDLLRSLDARGDVLVLGVYLEGFANLDGLETVRAVSDLSAKGKTVVFYKAGRTASGRSAAAGHTAAVAGDYDICQTALRRAGAIIVEDFRTFSQVVELATFLAGKKAGGRIFAVTNAGMEAVGMADSLSGSMPGVNFEAPAEIFEAELASILERNRLQSLVTLRNPLDLTPMASERVYDEVVKAALARPEVDSLIVSCVPLAPTLHTLADELDDDASFPNLVAGWTSDKPVVFVLDAGREYDPLADALRKEGLPVFRSADEALRILSLWVAHGKSASPRAAEPRSPAAERTDPSLASAPG